MILIRQIVLTMCLLLLAIPGRIGGRPDTPTTTAFPSATPEEVGMSSKALLELASTVARFVREDAIVGAELLVIKQRHVVLHETFGWRDREDQLPMERNTIFNIRSMTKTLVGAAAQILIDEGKLALDQPVARFLPAFDNDASRGITVEHLLTHRSGLPVSIVQGLHDYPDLISMANEAGKRGPEFVPGSRFSYSDAGADALGAVVQVASGVPLEEFLRTRIIEPLGMGDTFAALDAEDPRGDRVASLYIGRPGAWARAWKPHGTTGNQPSQGASLYPFLWGSQGLYSTPENYARFLSLWMKGGTFGTRSILSPDAIRRTLTPVSEMMAMGSDDIRQPTNFSGLETCYGQMAILHMPLGRDMKGNPMVIGHAGSDGTIAWAWPDRDLMVLYFTQSRGTTSYLRLERALEWLILEPESHRTIPDPTRLVPFLGTYVANFGPFKDAAFRVFDQDGFLAVDVPGQFSTELRDPDAQDRWQSVLVDRVSVSFDKGASGEVTAMRWRDGDQVFLLPRAVPAAEKAAGPAETLGKFTGAYRDPEAERDVKVVTHREGLAVSVPGTGLVELVGPDSEGFFRLRLNPAVRIRFDETPDGAVVSYTVYTPDGKTFVRPRIREVR